MRRGFTMIEVMVAGAILAIGCLGILAMLLTTIDYNRQAHLRTQAVTLAEQQLALLEAQASNAGNWNLPDSNNSILKKIQSKATEGGWFTPTDFIFNVNGATDKIANNNMPDTQFALSYYVLPETAEYSRSEFLRGSIRVIWDRTSSKECLDANRITAMDKRNNDKFSSKCDFVSIPFALRK